jgi:hypothetical protein
VALGALGGYLLAEAADTLIFSKGGKQNVRDTELSGLSPQDIADRLKDPNLSSADRRRLQKQQRALGTRHIGLGDGKKKPCPK